MTITRDAAHHMLWMDGATDGEHRLGYPPGRFVTCLIEAIRAASPDNRARLAAGFPEYVAAFELMTTAGPEPLRAIANGEHTDQAVTCEVLRQRDPDRTHYLCRGASGVVDLSIYGDTAAVLYHSPVRDGGESYDRDCVILGVPCWFSWGEVETAYQLAGLTVAAIHTALVDLYRRYDWPGVRS